MPTWTEARVEELKGFLAAGLSASQIGDEMGVSRNAIISKTNRCHLEGHRPIGGPTRPKPSGPRKPRVQKRVVIRPRCNSGVEMAVVDVQVHETPVELATFDAAIPIGQRCALVDLTEHTCRWPIGHPCDADFYFCGGQVETGFPYCLGHARCAYQPGRARRPYIPPRRAAA